MRTAVPFLACGDLSQGDSDANYDLDPASYVHREPVQPPTTPAYKTAMALRQQQQGGQGLRPQGQAGAGGS